METIETFHHSTDDLKDISEYFENNFQQVVNVLSEGLKKVQTSLLSLIKNIQKQQKRFDNTQKSINAGGKHYTGFMFDNRTYYFKVLPFGLTTPVASFIRFLNLILGSEVEAFTLKYVEDLVVISGIFREHFQHLKLIFEKFRKANITLKLRKSSFVPQDITFLGHVMKYQRIKNF